MSECGGWLRRCTHLAMLVAVIFVFPSCQQAGRRTDQSGDRALGEPGRAFHFIGVWLEGTEIVYGRDQAKELGEQRAVGFIFAAGGVDGPTSPGECLESGRIVGCFRSAREAWHVAGEFDGVEWHHGVYAADGWRFTPQEPPRQDTLRYEHMAEARPGIGPANAGIRRNASASEVALFPPPLGQRGVAMAWWVPKARVLRMLPPWDQSCSIFVSWEDLEERLAEAEPQRLSYFRDGRQVWTSWERRETLKKAHDAKAGG